MWITSLISPNNHLRWVFLLSPLCRWRGWGAVVLSDLTELLRGGRIRIWILTSLRPKPTHSECLHFMAHPNSKTLLVKCNEMRQKRAPPCRKSHSFQKLGLTIFFRMEKKTCKIWFIPPETFQESASLKQLHMVKTYSCFSSFPFTQSAWEDFKCVGTMG